MNAKVLSERQKTVLAMLACGLSEKQVGTKLFIAYSTVHKDRKAGYNKLGANSFGKAIVLALLTGELTVEGLRATYNAIYGS